MKKHIAIILTFLISSFFTALTGQIEKCATMIILEKRIQNDPSALLRIEDMEAETSRWIEKNDNLLTYREIITIPVVVHVLWNTTVQNISDEQIYSQIDVLNQDFRRKNRDTLRTSHPFSVHTSDTGIEFCLASRDPEGNPTNGITRTNTSVNVWNEDKLDEIFFSIYGGKDNWDPNQYLNIYIANIDEDYLGFASLPSMMEKYPEYDGVVIRHEAFGTIGTAGTNGYFENTLGRTATHEVGHWLNLRHIWGDIECGNDFVTDTEPAEDANFYCPSFPHRTFNSCGGGQHGEMYMNFMDYTDDACMNMFTKGQADRMLAALNGRRSSIIYSEGCNILKAVEVEAAEVFMIFPNPGEGNFTVELLYDEAAHTIHILNILGQIVRKVDSPGTNMIQFDLKGDIPGGIYLVKVQSGHKTAIKKIVVKDM